MKPKVNLQQKRNHSVAREKADGRVDGRSDLETENFIAKHVFDVSMNTSGADTTVLNRLHTGHTLI